jgi:hypothetical protein
MPRGGVKERSPLIHQIGYCSIKAECLRLLATLKLDPARMQLISGFVDTYLRLNKLETQVFDRDLVNLD